MGDRYLLESGAPDGYQLEDGSGVLILDVATTTLVAGAPVVTFSATGTVRVASYIAVALAAVVTFSAPAATLQQSGGAGVLSAGAPVVTFSAPAAARVATRTATAGAPTVTFTAPVAIRIAGGRVLAATSPTVVFTAPTASLVQPFVGSTARPMQARGRGRSR